MERKSSLFKNLIFTIIIILLFLFVLEGLFRLASFIKNRLIYKGVVTILDTLPMAIPNADRIFELKPNYSQKYLSSEFQMDITTNSDGLRDIGHSISKPKNVYRIIALGDSMTFGWGVNQDDTWWKVLEDTLNSDKNTKYRYEIINLGVWMYTYDQQFLRLKDIGLKYQPDMVIQGIYWPHLRTISNHIWTKNESGVIAKISDPTFYISKDGLLKTKDKNIFLNFLKTHSKLFNFVINRLQVLFLKNQLITSDLGLLNKDSETNYQEVWQKAFESIKETKELLDKRGIEYFVFLIPRDVQVSQLEWVPLYTNIMNQGLYQSNIPQNIFNKFLVSQDITVLDLLPIFRKDYSPQLYFPIDPHWTEMGHTLAAEQIYNFLKIHFIK